MPIFTYKAKDGQGRYQKGQIEATTADRASQAVREHGLFVINISSKQEFSLDSLLWFKALVSDQDLSTFTRHLSSMLETGLPLTDALADLENQSNTAFADVVTQIRKDVTGGMSLSAAMSKHPKVFKRMYLSMVIAGETSGQVDKSLARLADSLEKTMELKGKIKGAMIYPIIVVFAMLGVGTAMMIFVIPILSDVYSSFGEDLPLPTRIILGISDLITDYTLIFFIVVIGIILALRSFKQTKSGEYLLSNLAFKLPVFGEINQEVLFATMTRTTGTLVGAGISILDALKIAAELVGNNIYRETLDLAARQVEKGFPFSMTLRNSDLYPPIFAQMTAIGEETGTMDKSFERLANYFEGNAERKIKNLTTALEPALIIVLGVAVAGLAIGILLPIFNLVNVIQ